MNELNKNRETRFNDNITINVNGMLINKHMRIDPYSYIESLKPIIFRYENPKTAGVHFNKFSADSNKIAISYGYVKPRNISSISKVNRAGVLQFLKRLTTYLTGDLRRRQGENAIELTKQVKKYRNNPRVLDKSISIQVSFKYVRNSVYREDIAHWNAEYFIEDFTYGGFEVDGNEVCYFKQIKVFRKYTKTHKKTVLFNTTERKFKQDLYAFIDRFKDSLGGYHTIYNVNVNKGTSITTFNALTVPLKAAKSSKLQFFNDKGELIVDNIDEGNDTCIIDFIYNNYVLVHSRKFGGDGRFPFMTKEKIAEEITSVWITTNKSSYNPLLDECEPKGRFEEYDAKIHGVCILQLEEFCKSRNITLRCLTTDLNIFYSSIAENTKKSIPMMVIIDDGHIYNITDKTIRQSIKNSGRGAVHMGILNEKKENLTAKQSYEASHLVQEQITYDEVRKFIDEDKKQSIFITGEQDLEQIYIDLWKNGDKHQYESRCNIMTEIKLKNSSIYYNQDYIAVLDICKNLQIPFKNQTLISIGLQIYNQVNPNFGLDNFHSHFNNESLDIKT